MPTNNQIRKEPGFETGDLVTAKTLNDIANEAKLLKGAIGEQDAITEPLQATDEVLVNDISDSVNIYPKKAKVSDLLLVNSPIVATTAQVEEINSKPDTGIDLNVDLPETAHNVTFTLERNGLNALLKVSLPINDWPIGARFIVTNSTIPNLNGLRKVDVHYNGVSTHWGSFVYEVYKDGLFQTLQTGTMSITKLTSLDINANVYVNENAVIEKDVKIQGNVLVNGTIGSTTRNPIVIEGKNGITVPRHSAATNSDAPHLGPFAPGTLRWNADYNTFEYREEGPTGTSNNFTKLIPVQQATRIIYLPFRGTSEVGWDQPVWSLDNLVVPKGHSLSVAIHAVTVSWGGNTRNDHYYNVRLKTRKAGVSTLRQAQDVYLAPYGSSGPVALMAEISWTETWNQVNPSDPATWTPTPISLFVDVGGPGSLRGHASWTSAVGHFALRYNNPGLPSTI